MKTSRRVMYLRDLKGMPVGCVAISLNKDRTQIRYQLSVLNPVDKFERDLARHIAYGRLLEKPVRIPADSNWKKFDITAEVMVDIFHSKTTPARAKRAARLWMDDNGVS